MNAKYQKLIRFNKIMAMLHFVQALAVIALSTKFSLPVTQSYQAFDPSTQTLNIASRHLFDIRLAWVVAAFFLLSSFAHFYVSILRPRWYIANLKLDINKARWIEYALSASLMMVAIAMLAGMEDLSSLIMVFALVGIMNLMGLVMEVYNQTARKTNWLSYWIGCLAGLAPWLAIGLYFWGAESATNGNIPTFVYWIYLSIFIFFNCFAINMVLQYKKAGKWIDYLYGEQAYIILSLVAKSALAWQIFAGTLRPV